MERNRFFLLGGHDLEMKTIADILSDCNIPFADHSLQWNNACVSSYKEELDKYGNSDMWNIYGIELQEDMPLPSNYIAIDHHTYNSNKPSSIEQVAELLGHKLTRYQQLVAINDVSYIAGLRQAGATDEEIALMRFDDRMEQGVTPEEEALAEQSVKDNKYVYGDLIVVHSATSRFSPICDRLYPYDKLLIYTDEELTYYGKGVEQLIELFKPMVEDKRIYYGGGPEGYMGVAKGSVTPSELEIIISKIKETVKNGI